MAKNPIQFQKGLSLADFLKDYGTEAQCHEALAHARWHAGFACPKCGETRATWLARRRLMQCADRACRHQASVTAGTVFHGSRVGLTKWFLAIYLITQNKASISALALSRQLGVNYDTAWAIKHKLADVMLERNGTRRLEGRVELDDAYLGGENEGKSGRGSENKLPFVAAVSTVKGRPAYVQLRTVAGFTSAAIRDWAKTGLQAGAHVVTDGLACFSAVAAAGCSHAVTVTSRIHRPEGLSSFKWVNTVLGNLKSALTGTLRAIRPAHASRYLAEFEYRFNHRFHMEDMVPRLAFDAISTGPRPYRSLIAAEGIG